MKVLVSACMLGERGFLYHGGYCNFLLLALHSWEKAGHVLVPVCPELLAGFDCPRPPTRIRNGRWIMQGIGDVTERFADGASEALEIGIETGVDVAILLKKSPACDSEMGAFGLLAATRWPAYCLSRACMKTVVPDIEEVLGNWRALRAGQLTLDAALQ